MNKKQAAFAAAGLIAVAAAAEYFTILSSENALFARFPDIDPKIVVKAHRKMILRALKGEYNSLASFDDSTNERIFLQIVEEIQSK